MEMKVQFESYSKLGEDLDTLPWSYDCFTDAVFGRAVRKGWIV
jgi:hypothetical protein